MNIFDAKAPIFNEDGEIDEGACHAYLDGLMSAFEASPEGQALLASHGYLGWVAMMGDFATGYRGAAPLEMTLADFREVLWELFPRKVSCPPTDAPEIIAALSAFWTFADRAFLAPHAKAILKELSDGATDRMKRELANPQNFGMAKALFSHGGLFDQGSPLPGLLDVNQEVSPLSSSDANRKAKLKDARRKQRKREKAAKKRSR